MKFTYVYIPEDDNEAVQLLEGDGAGGLTEDKLTRSVKEFFSGSGTAASGGSSSTALTAAQEGVLASEIRSSAIRAGGNASQLAAVSDAALVAIHNSSSCEITALTVPTSSNSYRAVSMYSDDKAAGKGLLANRRATELARACGHGSAAVLGGAFVSRYHDNEEQDIWERVNFSIEDASPDSAWCTAGGGGGGTGSGSSLSGMLDQFRGQQGGQGGSDVMQMGRALPSQSGVREIQEGSYKWSQGDDEVELKVPVEGGVSGKDVKVKFHASSIEVNVKGEALLRGDLGGGVLIDDCTWCLDNGELQITLGKRDGSQRWECAIKSE